MGCCRNIAAIAIVSSNPKSWPGLQALVIHTLDSTMQRISFWETRIALSTGGLSSGYRYPPFEHLGQAHFSLYFPISLPHSYSCSYSGSGSYSLFRFPALPDARPVKSTSSHRLVTSSQFSSVLDGSRETGW